MMNHAELNQDSPAEIYDGLDFDRAELSAAMRSYYSDILGFITQPAFQVAFSEMMALDPKERPGFVNDVWLEPEVLKERGMTVPDGILIQTSAFGDRRPTLFVVKKFLPEKFHSAWENVNWTFNNDFDDADVPYDAESSWRFPLSVAAQNALIEKGVDLQSIDDDDEELSQRLDGDNIVKSQRIDA